MARTFRSIERRIMAATFPRSLGIRVQAGPGRCRATAPLRSESRQVHGVAHGGWIATLADTCQTAAAYTVLPPGGELLTTDFTLRFLRPLERGPARAEARVVQAGRRIVIVDAEVLDGRGDVVARGSFANLVLSERP